MNMLRNKVSNRFMALVLSLTLVFAVTVPTTGCALWCSITKCENSPANYTLVTYKALNATNIAAKTAMTILKYELVPSGKVSKETEAKIVKVYEDYGLAFQAACDGLILSDTVRADEAFTAVKSLFNQLVALLRSVGIMSNPKLTPETSKLLVEYPATAKLSTEKGK